MHNDESKAHRIKAIAARLKCTSRIARAVNGLNDRSAEEEAWQIAAGLLDIEESTKRLFDELVPKLLSLSPGNDDIEDIVTDIGEEYRHMLYHIRDTTFFTYLFADE